MEAAVLAPRSLLRWRVKPGPGPSRCENSSRGRCQGKSVQSYGAGLKPPKEGKCSFGKRARARGIQLREEFREQTRLSYKVHRKVVGANSKIFHNEICKSLKNVDFSRLKF